MKGENRQVIADRLPFRYDDLYLRTGLALIASHFVVVNGIKANLFRLLLDYGYYIELGFSFAASMTILWWINRASMRMDKKYPWEANLERRLLLQLLLGVLVPVIFEFFVVTIYFSAAGVNILKTSFLNREFHLVVFMILTANLYYATYYFYHRLKQQKQAEGKTQVIPSTEKENLINAVEISTVDRIPAPEPATGSELQETEDAPEIKKEIFIVHTPKRSIPLRISDIAYIYRINKANFIRTFNGEDFLINDLLKDIEAQFPSEIFFRINRQMIIHIDTCSSFSAGDKEGTLYISFNPPYGSGENEEDRAMCSVPEERVARFKAWIER